MPIRALHAALLAALALPPSSPEPPPLPYVRGPSHWLYRSNFGPARVRLDELGVEGAARLYRWAIEVAGASMGEDLALTHHGLFITGREFRFLGLRLSQLRLIQPEWVVAAPLEVGHRWHARWEGIDPGRPERPPVRGELEGWTEALEVLRVPAGEFTAYRIRLLRTDDQGGRVQTVIWLDPQVGVVKADGWLWWPGPIGAVQRLLGLTSLHVELEEIHLRQAARGTLPLPGAAGVEP